MSEAIIAKKAELVDVVAEKMKAAASIVVVDARGLTVEQDTVLRRELRGRRDSCTCNSSKPRRTSFYAPFCTSSASAQRCSCSQSGCRKQRRRGLILSYTA